MRLSLIVAVGRNGVIGHEGRLPWHLPADLKQFKALTFGKPIIMGRGTYESIGRALPGRRNIVVSGRPTFQAAGCEVAESPAAALSLVEQDEEVFCIGGASLYEQLLPFAQRIYLTRVDAEVEGDRYWPEPDPDQWRAVSRERREPDPANPYPLEFSVLERNSV
jgi:dihydrofolate reductase